jgi:hypothetical protein
MPKNAKRTPRLKDPFTQLRTDSEVKNAVEKLDKVRFNDALARSVESLATFFNFASYKRSAQFLKTKLKRLSPDAEAVYKGRLEQAVAAYRTALGAGEEMSVLFSNSGFDVMLEHKHKILFQLTPRNPNTERLSRFFGNLGATDADVSGFLAQLRAKGWNPFRFGTNGKFSGVVQSMRDHLPSVEKELEAVKHHGVPVIEGAVPVVLAVVLMVIIGVISCCELKIFNPNNCPLDPCVS